MGKSTALLIRKFAVDGHEQIFNVSVALPSGKSLRWPLEVGERPTLPVWMCWRRNEPPAAAGDRVTYGPANNFFQRFTNFT
jgi:hypothetical protein